MSRSKAVKKALLHKDKLHEGAKKRKSLGKRDTAEALGAEFKRGTLRSGSGQHVKSVQQLKAIIVSETKKKKKK